ncbi:UDP-N-acetylmuramoyl-tripeptide--D-alanyl-D-alanine ligase [Maricaulaceae bacterium NA33B04]|nr:UDP-N-acetylmuramoyl-tripeptide--D-alanyl-D-alanine ligase [Maricaulaceae bacterium NA33B04]
MSSAPLWTAAEAARATQGQLTDGGWTAAGVSIDTRTIQPGDLFVALTDQRDGHDFAQAALDAGAAAVLVSKPEAASGPRLVVRDVLSALRDLGAAARERSDAVRVGVTGSVGKTSVKEALAAVFRAAGRAHWSEKSYNNHWGVPLTLSRMPRETERGVFEMGMNHAGEIADLVSMVRPHVALITKIVPAHLENLGSMEAIADAKAEIFTALADDGVAIIPADDEFAPRLSEAVRRSKAGFLIDFGHAPTAAVRVLRYEDGAEGGVGQMDVMGRLLDFRLKLTGAHQAVNAAGVVAAALAAGVEPELAIDALSQLEPAAGRGSVFTRDLGDGRSVTVIDDSYNANPASMRAAFSALAARQPGKGGRRVAIIGEMLELGPQSEAMHADLAQPLTDAGAELVFGVGANARALLEALPDHVERQGFASAADAADTIQRQLVDGDLVLIKGSNASKVHTLAASLRQGRHAATTKA